MRSKLLAEGEITTVTPRLGFPEFRNSQGWSTRPLGGEGDFLSSLTGKTAAYFGTGSAKHITYMNVFSNSFADMSSLGMVDVDDDESQNAVKSGDVLFTVSSETPEDVGMASVVLETAPRCYLNSFRTFFRFADGKQPNPPQWKASIDHGERIAKRRSTKIKR